MIFRSIVESDLDRFIPLFVTDPACDLPADKYRARLADGQYRPHWTWIAEDPSGGEPLAVATWWGGPDQDRPGALDGLFVHDSVGSAADRSALAAELLRTAHAAFAEQGLTVPPDYHIFLPADWHDRPDAVAALAWRQEAARLAGLPAGVERLRYEWTPGAGLPKAPERLLFHAEPDDEVFVDLFSRVLAGTLDAASHKEAERIGAEAQARGDVAFYRDTMPGDRSWWRIARTPDGAAVGFGLPSRNHDNAVVGYLAVLPEHRGHGYADEILAEITRILVAEIEPELIRADTDRTNAPMAAAFERAGYRNSGCRLVLSAR